MRSRRTGRFHRRPVRNAPVQNPGSRRYRSDAADRSVPSVPPPCRTGWWAHRNLSSDIPSSHRRGVLPVGEIPHNYIRFFSGTESTTLLIPNTGTRNRLLFVSRIPYAFHKYSAVHSDVMSGASSIAGHEMYSVPDPGPRTGDPDAAPCRIRKDRNDPHNFHFSARSGIHTRTRLLYLERLLRKNFRHGPAAWGLPVRHTEDRSGPRPAQTYGIRSLPE